MWLLLLLTLVELSLDESEDTGEGLCALRKLVEEALPSPAEDEVSCCLKIIGDGLKQYRKKVYFQIRQSIQNNLTDCHQSHFL